MFCPECKAELPDDAKFCIRCGYDFTRIKTPSPDQPSDLLGRLRTSPKPDQPEVPSDFGEALKEGEVFARRYRILSDGKRGGMGVVYKCEDQKLNRTVALKIIHPRLLSSEQAVKRFRQEVSISLELLHKNIVRVHNLDEYEGIEFFTMEWVEGKSLREILNERVKEKKPFTLGEASEIISQLSDALQNAHKSTIHRDIKPENILTYKDEEGLHIKVTDFGIAKMLTPAQFTTTSLQIGTPYYMAPEQKIDAAHVDKRADIYAVGVVLFELLTLENTIGLEMPSEINQDLPKEIDQIIKKAIATKPENRYRDVKELSGELGNVVQIWKQRIEEERRRAEELRKKEEERLRREAEEAEKGRREEERKRKEEEEKRRQIEAVLDEGKVQLNNNKFDQAIKTFERVLSLDRRNKEGEELLERAKSEKKRFEEARKKEEEEKRKVEEERKREEKRKREEDERIRNEVEEKKRAEEAKERALWLIQRGKESESAGKYQEALNYYREADKKSIYVSAKDLIVEIERKIGEEEDKERKRKEEEGRFVEEKKRTDEAGRKRKEEEEARRRKRKTVFWSGLAVIGVILLIVYFGYRKRQTPQVAPPVLKEEFQELSPPVEGREVYEFALKFGKGGTGVGEFNSISGIACDSSSIYVAESHNRIQKFTLDGKFLTKWGSEGSSDGQFKNLGGIAITQSNVYVSDIFNSRIQKFTLDGEFLTKWGSEGSGDGQFKQPIGIAVDLSGNVFVVDRMNHRIQKFGTDGAFIAKFGSKGSGDGEFERPTRIAIDNSNIYISDSYNNRIQKFTLDGKFITKWGSKGSGDGQFITPGSIAVDTSRIYVTDAYNHRVQKFTKEGKFITKWGSPGLYDGQFLFPGSISISPSGIYVADIDSNRIQKFIQKIGSSDAPRSLTTHSSTAKGFEPSISLGVGGRVIVWGDTGLIYGFEYDNLKLIKNFLQYLGRGREFNGRLKILYTGDCDPRKDSKLCNFTSDFKKLEPFFSMVGELGTIDFNRISSVSTSEYSLIIANFCGKWSNEQEEIETLKKYIMKGGRALIAGDYFCVGYAPTAAQANQILFPLGALFTRMPFLKEDKLTIPSEKQVGLFDGVKVIRISREPKVIITHSFEPVLESEWGILAASCQK